MRRLLEEGNFRGLAIGDPHMVGCSDKQVLIVAFAVLWAWWV